jgi:hypothetical protein
MRNMSKIHPIRSLTLLAVALTLGLGTGASALTLADLDAGASFNDGTLTFSDFNVTLPATVGASPNALASVDLALFEVEVLPASGFGFRVLEFDIPLVASGDQIGQMQIDYKVTANPTTVLTGAGIRFTGTAIGTGAITRIDQLVSTPAGSIDLHVIRQAGGTQDPEDAAALPAPNGREALVAKTITLDVRSRSAFIAQISEIEGQFSVAPIPEPGAVAIFAGSLMLVTAASRRRWI